MAAPTYTIAEELIMDCFKAVLDQPVASERMDKTKELSKKLLAEVETEKGRKALETFASKVSEELLKVVDKASSSKFSSMKVKMWRQFHDIRTTKLNQLYCQFLKEVSVTEADPLLIQHTFSKMFEGTLKFKFSSSTETKPAPDLTSNDHNALRYTAGFIPHALKKKIVKSSHPSKESFLACLSSMGTKGQSPDVSAEETFHSFTKKWITAVNRGGLFFVSDEVYTFFLELEKKTRKFLPELIRQGSVNKEAVLTEITADDNVQFFWCIISTDIDDEEASQELLYKIVELWLTIRGFSIAGSFVEYYKQCTKESNKKKSLRKGLKRKHEDSTSGKGKEPEKRKNQPERETEEDHFDADIMEEFDIIQDEESDDEPFDMDNI